MNTATSSSVNKVHHKIRAVVFDCFGVLYHDGFKEFLARNRHQLTEPIEYYYDLMRQYDSGFLPETELYEALSLASNEKPAAIRSLLENVLTINRDLVELMGELKPYFRLGLLSNAGRSSLQAYLDHEGAGRHLDVVLASSEVGMVKPQPEIYRLLAERLGLQMDEIVFIDDSPGHVEAAQSLGMKAHAYKDMPDLRQYLDQVLGD